MTGLALTLTFDLQAILRLACIWVASGSAKVSNGKLWKLLECSDIFIGCIPFRRSTNTTKILKALWIMFCHVRQIWTYYDRRRNHGNMGSVSFFLTRDISSLFGGCNCTNSDWSSERRYKSWQNAHIWNEISKHWGHNPWTQLVSPTHRQSDVPTCLTWVFVHLASSNIFIPLPQLNSHDTPHRLLPLSVFLARDAFVRTNRRAIVVMFVRPSVWDGRVLWSYNAR